MRAQLPVWSSLCLLVLLLTQPLMAKRPPLRAEPAISVSPNSLTFLNSTQLPGSNTQTYTVSATNLTASQLLITAPAPYLISVTPGSFGRSQALPVANGAVAPTSVTVALVSSQSGTFNGTITNVAGSASITVALSGTTLSPSLSVRPAGLTGFTTTEGAPSAIQTYTITALSQTGGYATAPAGFQLRTGTNAFGTSVLIPGSLSPINLPVDVRLSGANVGPFAGSITHQLYNSSNQSVANVAVSGTVSATVPAAVLGVLHRDVDNYADNNAIQPLLVLQNQGNTALPLSKLTLRYYLTVEGSASLSNLNVNYAQVGNGNVRLRYVAINPSQSGASGYVEVSFTAGAGNLAAGANTGPIQAYFTKSDYGALYEPDDYSYNPLRDQLTPNLRITAYYDGVLVAGIEPGSGAQVRSLRALTESKNGPSATQINTFLEVRNEGTTAVNYSDLKVRYYFTVDGNEPLQVEVDEGNVQARVYGLVTPGPNADSYLELTFNQAGQLLPGTSTGTLRYRISKPQGGRFNQANDWSYQEQPADRSQNPHVVVLVGGELAWGSNPPGASARQAAGVEPGSGLAVRLLDNPVVGGALEAEVMGAEGQPLMLQLLDLQGRPLSRHGIEAATASQRIKLNLGQAAPGLLLLEVSSPTARQVLKVLRLE